jgi:hypothetical protein
MDAARNFPSEETGPQSLARVGVLFRFGIPARIPNAPPIRAFHVWKDMARVEHRNIYVGSQGDGWQRGATKNITLHDLESIVFGPCRHTIAQAVTHVATIEFQPEAA